MGAEDFDDTWEVHGDVPTTDPGWLVEPAEEHFQRKAHASNRNIPSDHEVATVVKDKIIPVFTEHKKGIIEVTAAALTVAVVFRLKRGCNGHKDAGYLAGAVKLE